MINYDRVKKGQFSIGKLSFLFNIAEDGNLAALFQYTAMIEPYILIPSPLIKLYTPNVSLSKILNATKFPSGASSLTPNVL